MARPKKEVKAPEKVYSKEEQEAIKAAFASATETFGTKKKAMEEKFAAELAAAEHKHMSEPTKALIAWLQAEGAARGGEIVETDIGGKVYYVRQKEGVPSLCQGRTRSSV